MRVRLSPLARQDVTSIHTYLAEHAGASIAGLVIDRIGVLVSTLALFPRIGRQGHEPGTFETIVPRSPFVVVYRIDIGDGGDELIELRVYHTSRERS